jgi:beta-galactosidase/beta-glucuronidase
LVQFLKTYSASWEEQGLGWYKQGPAWYRVSIDVPNRQAGENLRLWFGGVDETAEVYANGHKIGESKGFARPFEFSVGHLLQYGRKNLIAVKCRNRELAELGTGGILRPVMLYAARDQLPHETDRSQP